MLPGSYFHSAVLFLGTLNTNNIVLLILYQPWSTVDPYLGVTVCCGIQCIRVLRGDASISSTIMYTTKCSDSFANRQALPFCAFAAAALHCIPCRILSGFLSTSAGGELL